jgi:hypothetical protein
MNGIGRRTRSGLFALATAAALGFGGAQAFASPGAAADAERACNGPQCREYCRSIGYDDGRCNQGSCGCLIVVPPSV